MTETRLSVLKSETRNLAEQERLGRRPAWDEDDAPWRAADTRFVLVLAAIGLAFAAIVALVR